MNIISWRLLSTDNYWRERSLIQNLTTAPHRSITSLFLKKFCIVYSCTTFNKWPLGGSMRSWEGFLLFQHTLHTQHHNKQRPTRASLENQRRTTGELRNSKRSLADGTRSRRWRTWVLSTREELVEAEMFSLKWAQVMKIIQTEAPTNAMYQQRRCASSTTPTPTRTGRVWNVWKVDWVVSFAVLSALICPIQLCFRFERFKFESLHLIHYFIFSDNSVPMVTWCVLAASIIYWPMPECGMRQQLVPTAGLRSARHCLLAIWLSKRLFQNYRPNANIVEMNIPGILWKSMRRRHVKNGNSIYHFLMILSIYFNVKL